jgi:hypothetical protein
LPVFLDTGWKPVLRRATNNSGLGSAYGEVGVTCSVIAGKVAKPAGCASLWVISSLRFQQTGDCGAVGIDLQTGICIASLI